MNVEQEFASVSRLSKSEDFVSVGTVSQLDIDGEYLSVWYANGSDNTIVFLHGNSACKEVFYRQMHYFYHLGYSVLALDLPGHGLSADSNTPEQTYIGSAYARLIGKVLQHFDITEPLLVGWSLGGHIAIELVGQGIGAKGLCIMGTPPVGPCEPLDEAFLPTPSAAVTGQEQVTEEELAAYVRDVYGSLDPIPEYFQKTAKRTHGKARAIMMYNWHGAKDAHNQRKVIAETSVPTMVVHGLDEAFASYDYMSNLKWGNLWQGRFIELESVGHAPFLEMPDIFNAELTKFTVSVFEGKV